MGAVQFGLDTFGDVTVDEAGGTLSQAAVIRNVVAQGVLADQVGVNAFGIGEHHRPDFAVSAPDIILAGLATSTERIRLGSAVTVLSSDDPIRVVQRFSTIDAMSSGRAEVTLGRGSFIESFPLFGFALEDYNKLFAEKLDLYAHVLAGGPVTWEGSVRPPVPGLHVYPPTESGTLRTWIAVGGSPESVVRAAQYRFPLMLAIIGGGADRFAPMVDLYHRAMDQFESEDADVPWSEYAGRRQVGVHSPGHIAETDEQAREELYPHFKANRDRIGAERGWGPMSPDEFTREADEGALYVGSPETVARKIAQTVKSLKLDRFDLKYSNGPMPHAQSMTAIELYGTAVIPLVREMLS